jgi:hypothetical protein
MVSNVLDVLYIGISRSAVSALERILGVRSLSPPPNSGSE